MGGGGGAPALNIVPSRSRVTVVRKEAKISAVSLVIIGFFWISGGIYGNEELILVASPNYALPALVITPFLYGLPLMLMTAELASALPYEAGNIAWVKEAWGLKIGTHNAYWVWVSYTLDASLYPRFAASYLAKALGSDSVGAIADVIVVLVTLIKLVGTTSVIKFSTLLSVLSILPSLLFITLTFKHVNTEPLTHTNGETNWDELVTWALWLYSGVFSLGSVAKEVENPERSYIISCVVLLLLDVFIINFFPLWISLSIDSDRSKYSAGHFADLGREAVGAWLSILLTLGAQVSQIGLYNSCSMAADRYLYGLLRDMPMAKEMRKRQTSDASEGDTNAAKHLPVFSRAYLKHFFLDTTNTGAPRLAILVNFVIHFFVAWLPITQTLSLSMVVTSMALILFVISFLKLKFDRPELDRRYRVPGHKVGALLWALPCVSLSILNIAFGLAADGMSVKVIFLIVVVGFGLLCHAGYVFSQRYWQSPAAMELDTLRRSIQCLSENDAENDTQDNADNSQHTPVHVEMAKVHAAVLQTEDSKPPSATDVVAEDNSPPAAKNQYPNPPSV